jgi:hypothetical protein
MWDMLISWIILLLKYSSSYAEHDVAAWAGHQSKH